MTISVERVCSVEGCGRTDRVARDGWCHKHYERWRTTGDVRLHRPTFLERIEPKINRLAVGGCWEWTAFKNPAGYGQTCVHGRVRLAHRAVYEALVGPIPAGLTLDHLCRNHACVNPAHLEAVTTGENTRRGDPRLRGAYQRAKTHCPRGHPYDEANTGHSGGSRYCRACHREKAREKARLRREWSAA